MFAKLKEDNLHKRNLTDVHSAVTAKTSTALRCDMSGSASAEIRMRTLVRQRWQLTVLRQRVSCHYFHSMCTSLSQPCQLTPLSQCSQCHRCHTAVSCHCGHTGVHSNVTVLSLSSFVAPLSVYIADIPMLLPLLSQCSLGHCCHSTVKRHRDTERKRQTDDDDETLFKHGIYISKNTALQKSRETLIKILKLNLSIYKFIKYAKYNTQ